MEKPRQKVEKPSATNVARAAHRAYKLVNQTSKGTKSSSVYNLLASALGRNRDLEIKPKQGVLSGIGIVKKGVSAATPKKVFKSKKPRRPSLAELIKAPMTKAEAQVLSQRLNDPDRPKRKLPPRP